MRFLLRFFLGRDHSFLLILFACAAVTLFGNASFGVYLAVWVAGWVGITALEDLYASWRAQ